MSDAAATLTPQAIEAIEGMLEDFAQFRCDPYGFVLYSYPWLQPGTRLADYDGPDDWQIEVLVHVGQEVAKREGDPAAAWAAIKIAVASGHGIGKTALIAWLIHWFLCCFPFPQIKVTAGTMNQLSGKTWRELAVWHRMSIQESFFLWTATRFALREAKERWFAEAIPWSEHNSDSFAGTHERYVMYLFDEGSTIADIIWEVSEGAMTTPLCIWIVFGNPVRNTGRFRECFRKRRKYWWTRRVDARAARMTNKAQIALWEEEYADKEDWRRTRIYGQFPEQAVNQLIPEAAVDRCRTLDLPGHTVFPVRIGCDVARFGDDDTTIIVMRGRVALESFAFHHKDTIQIYTKLVQLWNHWRTECDNVVLFVDDGGIGGAVTDMLARVKGLRVIPVDSGASALEKDRFNRIRMEMWWTMALAVKKGLDLRALDGKFFERMKDDMINIEYVQAAQSMIYTLESVKSLKDRGLPSPDYATSLALTLAYPVPSVPDLSMTGMGSAVLKRKTKGGTSVGRRRREGRR
jgi:hypothetical protein